MSTPENRRTAGRILAALAKGIHPDTGEVIRRGDPLRHPETVEALRLGIEALEGAPPLRESEILATTPTNSWKSPTTDRPGVALLKAVKEVWTPGDSPRSESEIWSVIDEFPPRTARILSLRFGRDGEAKTLQEIGDTFGVTRERIRQILVKGLRRLGHRSRQRRLWSAALGENAGNAVGAPRGSLDGSDPSPTSKTASLRHEDDCAEEPSCPVHLDSPVASLELGDRARNALSRSSLKTIRQVLASNDHDLLRIRNFGRISLEALRAQLLRAGIPDVLAYPLFRGELLANRYPKGGVLAEALGSSGGASATYLASRELTRGAQMLLNAVPRQRDPQGTPVEDAMVWARVDMLRGGISEILGMRFGRSGRPLDWHDIAQRQRIPVDRAMQLAEVGLNRLAHDDHWLHLWIRLPKS